MRLGIDARSLTGFKAGIGIYLEGILEQWKEEVWASDVCLCSHAPFDSAGLNVFDSLIANARWGLPWYLFQAHRAIRAKGIDVFWGAQNLLPVRLDRTVPALVTVHDCVHRLGLRYAPSVPHNLLHRLFIPRSIERSMRVLTVSRFVADELRQLYHVTPRQIEVTPPGVARVFDRAHMSEENVAAVLDKYNLRPPYVLGVGTLEPRKNLRTLLQAFALLPADLQKEYQLVLVGKTGWKQREFFKHLKSHSLASHIILTGYVPRQDLPFLYAGAEMFVFPSLYEGFGLPVLEAMAAGCPVITSNGSALKELASSAGVLVDPHAVAASWSRAISRLARSRELRKDLSAKGAVQASRYRWDACAKRTLEVIKEVASR